jgi:hypothetical protein
MGNFTYTIKREIRERTIKPIAEQNFHGCILNDDIVLFTSRKFQRLQFFFIVNKMIKVFSPITFHGEINETW